MKQYEFGKTALKVSVLVCVVLFLISRANSKHHEWGAGQNKAQSANAGQNAQTTKQQSQSEFLFKDGANGFGRLPADQCYQYEEIGDCAARIVQQRVYGLYKILAWIGGGEVFVTFLTVFVLIAQTRITHRQTGLIDGQLKATERAASAAIAAQRPWIKVSSITLDAPISVNNETQAVIAVTATLENIGNTPAVRLNIQTRICFDFGALETIMTPSETESRQLREMGRGAIVFPKEPFDPHIRIWAAIPELPFAAVTIIAGVVSYGFGKDIGTTTFAYSLTHRIHGPHFIRHLQFHPGEVALQSDIVIERLRIMGNDAT